MKALLALFLLQFTQPAPLTNTRYDAVDAAAVLTSNGSEFFIVWTAGSFVRIARLGDGEPRVGTPVLSTDGAGAEPSIVWTGTQFVVASRNRVRVLDARGQPAGPEITLPASYESKLATNGRNIVLITDAGTKVRAYVLTLSGVPLDGGTEIASSLEADDAAIASDGREYLVITTSGAGVRITKLDENGRLVTQRTVPGEWSNLAPAIASNGTDYFAVWTVGLGHLRGAFIKSDGTVETPFDVATMPRLAPYVPLFYVAGSVTWTGSHYAVAYGLRNESGKFLSYEVRRIGGDRTDLEGQAFARPSLAYAAGRLLVSWGTANGVMVRDLTRNDVGYRATWMATRQGLREAVASANGTLILWGETPRTTRMGFRGYDGSWSEREMPLTFDRIAATNGQEFVIVGNDYVAGTATATFVSASGVPDAGTVTIPFRATGIAWNGAEYVLVGARSYWHEVVAARLSPSGALSPTVFVSARDLYYLQNARVASDGTNVLIASVEFRERCGSPICLGPILSIETVLLDRNLQRITAPIRTRLDAEAVDVVWAGTHYVVVYQVPFKRKIEAMRVSQAGLIASFTTVATTPDRLTPIAATRIGNAVAIAWPEGEVRLLHDGNISTPIAFSSAGIPAIVELPGNRMGYLGTQTLVDEPYGSTRVVMAIGDATRSPPPGPPAVSARVEGNSMIVTWTPPPQPVQGYRLEYQIGEEGWLELERWFAPDERSAVFALPKRRVPYAFRVRAWSDGGTSAYSNTAVLSLARRRSVR